MNIMAKREYLSTVRLRYKSTRSRKEKSEIIGEVVQNLQITRKSAIRRLNSAPYIRARIRKGREKIYGYDLIKPLTILWEVTGYPCSKRLKPQISELITKLKKFQELTLYHGQERLLKKMGHSTIDTLLSFERLKTKPHGLSGTKRSPLLKTLIPIRTEFNDVTEPGHIEMDCVLHCGESLSGKYAETVNMLDIHTHWNEKKMIVNKNYLTIAGTIHILRKAFPFPIQSVDFDNGKEFINWHLYEYCRREHIDFTRSRSYHKNDQAHIEGKNYQSVRRVVGYGRIDNLHVVELINDIYANEHRLLTNFFYPTFKLKEKRKSQNGTVKKIYEVPKTPYHRVLESKRISKEEKQALRTQYKTLNPAQLHRALKKKLKYIQSLIR